ncbi:TonB-dependent receptor [Chitinophaga qingshengii]|uniref:TonB-dependent receptor n=1 Tax=Chitinophaga qingshengii TaxID=1569794 RepID=A0ABR7TQ61_9BACT|nr:TonB-dependent receptor [Chitinophaga qingshengii]MBC9931780.1 TonB-dependent receptor [Chitinophaga qingshengii]
MFIICLLSFSDFIVEFVFHNIHSPVVAAHMKKLLAFIICLAVYSTSHAQHAKISGQVTDTLNHVKLSNTVVALLHAKDSILYQFVRTGETGAFRFEHIPAGKYLLMITYPAFADYVEPVTLSDTSHVHDDNIMMTLRSRLLQEVVVQQKVAAIKMKGDTTEFNAGSYQTQPNASVEDLLKKLPGIQVDNKGQITAQGQKVKKVLVDGEEFFGDDPTLVTKNLRADMIDKVQLYDKKSEQAAFTGVDDGQNSKTLNLKLKDNKKNGYFGTVSTGAGTNGIHDTQAMINMFKGKMKVGGYGFISSTGKTGLTWDEQEKYGQSQVENMISPDGDDLIFMNQDEFSGWDGRYSGKGYPLSQTGGIHFNNKWNQDKQNFGGNYKFMRMYVDGNSTTTTQNILPDNTTSYRRQQEHFNNNILRNRVDGRYEMQLDSSSSLRLDMNAGLDHKKSNSRFLSEFLDADSSLVNRNNRSLSVADDTRQLNSNLLWRKKLKKKGRTVSVNLSENYTLSDGDGVLYSFTEYFKKVTGIDSSALTDQRRVFRNENINASGTVTYTEPLSELSSLVANYGLTMTNSKSFRNSFNAGDGGKYDKIDSTYSNSYVFNLLMHKAGLAYMYNGKKLRIQAGNNLGFTTFHQDDVYHQNNMDRRFVNWYPAGSIRYVFSQQRRLGLHYNGYTQQPSMNQLQPLRSNDDDQDVRIGNPGLKPSFNNTFRLSYNDFKVLSERSIWVSMNYSTTSNDFGESSFIDEKGRRTTRYVNVNGNQNAGVNVNLGWKLSSYLQLSSGLRSNYYRNAGYINDQLNVTKSTNTTAEIDLMGSKEKKYEHYLSVEAGYNTSRSSVQQSLRTNYWTYTVTFSETLFLPWKFQLQTDVVCNFRQKTPVFTGNNNVILWNAWLAKKFGKKEALELRASVKDILNQNIGFNRSVNSNFITQNTWSAISRYAMLSVTWNFNKMGGGAAQK